MRYARIQMGYVWTSKRAKRGRKEIEDAAYFDPFSKKNVEVESYERLEFLGDAVLGFIITLCLFLNKPGFNEGRMTQIKAGCVNNVVLCKIGKALGHDALVLTAFPASAVPDGIVADTVEAVLGALYVEKGMAACHRFVDRMMATYSVELHSLVMLPYEELKPKIGAYVNQYSLDLSTQLEEVFAEMHGDFIEKTHVNIMNRPLWLQVTF